MNRETLDFLEYEDIPEILQSFVDVIGIGATKDLWADMAGCTVYFPNTLSKANLHRFILDNYRGDNVTELAAKLGVTTQTIYTHLKAKLVL